MFLAVKGNRHLENPNRCYLSTEWMTAEFSSLAWYQ